MVREHGATAELVYAVARESCCSSTPVCRTSSVGRGIGGRLVEAAIEKSEREHLAIVPWCPFAANGCATIRTRSGSVRIDWESARAISRR